MTEPSRPPRGGQRVGIVEGWELRETHKQEANSGAWKGLVFVVGAILLLVVGGWFAARPVLGPAITGLFEENPSIIGVPIVADLLRAELADRIDQPSGPDDTEVKLVIAEGDIGQDDPVGDVHAVLAAQGLTTDPLAFRYMMIQDRVDQLIRPGTYTMRQSMSAAEVVAKLRSPDPPTPVTTLALRPGLRLEQIAAYLQQQTETTALELDPGEFRDLALKPGPELRDQYNFLKQLPRGNSLEGFLAGGVYEVPVDITADEFVNLLLEQWGEDSRDLVAQARKKKVNFYEALTIASLVEREAKVDGDRARIAGVYWNRLDGNVNKQTEGLMQADPTVVYASNTMDLADLGIKKWPDYRFWDTLGVDLETVDVPQALASQQTYQNPGLPGWPIATPTRKSIEAALNPNIKKKLLFFYACPGSDKHKFARTFAQHSRNIAKCN